jgi:hypothetical protein
VRLDERHPALARHRQSRDEDRAEVADDRDPAWRRRQARDPTGDGEDSADERPEGPTIAEQPTEASALVGWCMAVRSGDAVARLLDPLLDRDEIGRVGTIRDRQSTTWKADGDLLDPSKPGYAPFERGRTAASGEAVDG